MRRRLLFIFALPVFLAGLVMAAPAALAVSPHFINATATLTIQPPPSDITCPNGQRLELASATYTGVSITDTTTMPNVTESIPGTFSTGCLLPNVRGAC